MRKVTFGIVIVAAMLLTAGLVLRAPPPATASAPAPKSATVDPSALQSTIDVKGLPNLAAPAP